MTQRLFQWLFVALICGSFAQWSAAKDITSYKSTGELRWDKDFRKALPAFFGTRKASFFWSKGLIWEQAASGLGGPDDDIEKLSSSLYLASACRLHSCDEKAAAVIKQPGQIVAVGLVEYGCFRSAYRMPPHGQRYISMSEIGIAKPSKRSLTGRDALWATSKQK